MTVKTIKLTEPDGSPIWLVAAWVTRVSGVVSDMYSKQAHAIVWMSDGKQAVRERPEEIVSALENL